METKELAKNAKSATFEMAVATTDQKNQALHFIVELLKSRKNEILKANLQDIQEAEAAFLNQPMIERLSIQNSVEAICSSIEEIIKLENPVGVIFEERTHLKLKIKKMRTPIGVLAIIYESRPNVTIDCAALSIKSGNCALLRGGSEALRTNTLLTDLIQEALLKAKLPVFAVQLIKSRDRVEIKKMVRLKDTIDLIIPRGGANLHRLCLENSKIPVMSGGMGVCHLFVDEFANLAKSMDLILNAKVQRPTVCNALDTLLVHEKIANIFIPQIMNLLSKHKVTFKLDKKSYTIAKKNQCEENFELAKAKDFDTEWLSLVLNIKVVKNLELAIAHIRKYSTAHSDGILTDNEQNAQHFINSVDSAAVYVNASTRFTDGGQFGLGAEIAVSTQKLHARGPMGLTELTSYKWVVSADYASRS